MNEPLRWLEDTSTSSRLREVLGAATSAPPLPANLHVELSSYAAGLVAQGVLAKAGTGSLFGKALFTKVASSALVKGIAVVSLMGAAGTASYVAVGERLTTGTRATPSAATTNHPVPQSLAARFANSGSLDEPAGSSTDEEASPISVESASERSGVAARAEPIAPQATSDLAPSAQKPSVADEARLLESARASLASDPAWSLQVIRHHQTRFPHGQLSAERELIAVDALLRLGRRDEAERRAAPRLAEDADSLYAKRFRQLLGHESPSGQ